MLGQPSASGAVIGWLRVKSNLSRALNGILRRFRWETPFRLASRGITVIDAASFRPRCARSLGSRSRAASGGRPFQGLVSGR